MGDMTNFNLGGLSEQEAHFYRHQNTSLVNQYEEGLVDERGIEPLNAALLKMRTQCPKWQEKIK